MEGRSPQKNRRLSRPACHPCPASPISAPVPHSHGSGALEGSGPRWVVVVGRGSHGHAGGQRWLGKHAERVILVVISDTAPDQLDHLLFVDDLG